MRSEGSGAVTVEERRVATETMQFKLPPEASRGGR